MPVALLSETEGRRWGRFGGELTVDHLQLVPRPQLRHTFGTAVKRSSGIPRLTAELLGRSGLGAVSGYTKISRRRREEAAAALADRRF